MFGPIVIFFFTVAVYVPLSVALFYVWWKHGKDEKGVTIARFVYSMGSLFLFWYMLML